MPLLKKCPTEGSKDLVPSHPVSTTLSTSTVPCLPSSFERLNTFLYIEGEFSI